MGTSAMVVKKVLKLRAISQVRLALPTDDEASCTSSTQCVETASGHCGHCDCSVSLNKASLVDYLKRSRSRCNEYKGPYCEVTCPTAEFSRCVSGRCEILSANSIDECAAKTSDPFELATCRSKIAEHTLQLADCPERAITGATASIYAACVTLVAKSRPSEGRSYCDSLVGAARGQCLGRVLAHDSQPSPEGCTGDRSCILAFIDELDASKVSVNETTCGAFKSEFDQDRCRKLSTFKGVKIIGAAPVSPVAPVVPVTTPSTAEPLVKPVAPIGPVGPSAPTPISGPESK